MTSGREMTPPPSFLTLTPLPGPNASELPPITASTFTIRTLENTSLINHASTSNNPDPMISPAFVEANYERKGTQAHTSSRNYTNFTSGVFEGSKIEGRVVEIEDALNREGSRVEKNEEGGREGSRVEKNEEGGRTGSILNYKDLKAKFQSYFSQHKKFTKRHLTVHDIKQKEGESTRAFVTRFKKNSSWDNNKGRKNKGTFFPYQIYQIEEPVKSGRLAHLVKEVRKGRQKFRTLKRRIEEGGHRTIMVGRKPFITEHKLNELKHMEPRKQKNRGLAPERSEALHKEVQELTKAKILREVKYQTWVSNPLMIKKRRNLKVHVDDKVIKSDSEEDMLTDIQETFDKLWAINMKLNPRKCSFSAEEGPFLGYLITKQGIKANPSKVKAISDLRPPKMVKEIQSPNEKLAALSRFLSKGTDKILHFLKVLKNYASKKIVQWTLKAEEAFQKLKEYIETLPTVTTPIKGETLVMYLAISKESISAFLLAERGKKQVLIYFVSRALKRAKIEYPELEKITLSLVYAARRLRWYFQAHPIQILTNKPIKQILARLKKLGCIAKWAIELGEHDIEFKGCNFIKGYILVDFLAGIPTTKSKEKETHNAKNEELDP
nr:putative reverse transcriptase domain, ribonuclease H-like domain protein [Tanacetum cinerariifolium]